MTITNLRASPSVALVNTSVSLSPVGSPTGPDNTPRYYLASAPGDSRLLTLATRVAKNMSLEDCRLKLTSQGAEFTPDVVGLYECSLVNVTAVPFIPSWDGDAGVDGDDELTGAVSYTIDLRVVEKVTTTIGTGQDTATLTIHTCEDRVISPAEALALGVEAVTLTPASASTKAKLAAVSNDVLTVLDDLATVDERLSASFLIGFGPLYVDGDGTFDSAVETVRGLSILWAAHLAHASSYVTHGGVDAANVISASDATTLATACTLLNQARTKYEAHRVYTTGSVHSGPDGVVVHIIDPTLPAASDLETAADLWLEVWTKLNSHGSYSTVHGAPSNSPIDGTMGQQVERPRTTLQLIDRSNQLKALHNAHLGRTSNAAGHAVADTENVAIEIANFASLEGVAGIVNAIADGIGRHATNLKADGTAAASPYHEISGDPVTDPSARVQSRATAQNPESILITAAYCLRAMQAHALNDEVHGSRIWGRYGSATWPYYARLTQAWADVVQSAAPTPPPNTNSFAAIAKLTYGAKLQTREAAQILRLADARRAPSELAAPRACGAHLRDARVARSIQRVALHADVVSAGASGRARAARCAAHARGTSATSPALTTGPAATRAGLRAIGAHAAAALHVRAAGAWLTRRRPARAARGTCPGRAASAAVARAVASAVRQALLPALAGRRAHALERGAWGADVAAAPGCHAGACCPRGGAALATSASNPGARGPGLPRRAGLAGAARRPTAPCACLASAARRRVPGSASGVALARHAARAASAGRGTTAR